MLARSDDFGLRHHQLLEGLTEDLKLPFLQIQTKLQTLQNLPPQELEELRVSTELGIRLLESYRLALEIQRDSRQLQLEPFGVGASLQDAAHDLHDYAKQYQTELIIDVKGTLRPVMGYRRGFMAALYCLGTSLIRAQVSHGITKSSQLVLGAHALDDQRVAIGMFGIVEGITKNSLRTARRLQGRARQPLPALGANSASGILLADTLLSSHQDKLHSAHHNHQPGLAAHFFTARQVAMFS